LKAKSTQVLEFYLNNILFVHIHFFTRASSIQKVRKVVVSRDRVSDETTGASMCTKRAH